MTIGWFFDGLVILSAVLWLLRLALNGELSPEAVALALVGIAVFVAIARASGMGLVRLAFRVGVPAASLWTFVVGYTDGSYEQVVAVLATSSAATASPTW